MKFEDRNKISNIIKRIKRQIKFFFQRRTRGFDDSITWSLDTQISEWIIPRLKKFREIGAPKVTPGHMIMKKEEGAHEEWLRRIDMMIRAFEIAANEENCFIISEEQDAKDYEEGMDYFRKHFRDLWW